MRALAEFVMKGRRQAILAAVVAGVIPMMLATYVCAYIVALVTLRRGLQEGSIVLVWGLAPMAIWALYPGLALDGQSNLVPMLLLVAVTGLAQTLRASSSWQLTVSLLVLVGLLFEGYLALQPALVDATLEQLNQLLVQSGSEQPVGRQVMSTVFAIMYTVVTALLLVLARWMQARLYNPGGFGEEFRALIIEPRLATPLVVLLLLSGFGVLLPALWYVYFALPFLFAGTALVHATVRLKQVNPIWLSAYYMVLIFASQIVVLLALIDSWYDFRKIMRKPAS